MIYTFDGETADQAWRLALAKLTSTDADEHQGSRSGPTRELLHAMFSVRDCRQRWVTARQPAINPAFAIAEVCWILSGRNDAAFLNAWNRRLSHFAGTGTTYSGAYGHRLRQHFGLDQLERAYSALRQNPDTRQVVLQIWDPVADIPHADGKPAHEDVPCNLISTLKIRSGKLEWMQIIRSNDLQLGVPYNFIQFMTLQEVFAGWLNIQPGSYNQLSDSLHIYHRDLDLHSHQSNNALLPVLEVPEWNNDRLALPYEESKSMFFELSSLIEQLTKDDLMPERWRKIIAFHDLSQPYLNLLLVVAAEAARKKGWSKQAEEAITACTNPILKQVWLRWQRRTFKM